MELRQATMARANGPLAMAKSGRNSTGLDGYIYRYHNSIAFVKSIDFV